MHRTSAFFVLGAAGLFLTQGLAADRFSLHPFHVSSDSGYFQLGLTGRVFLEGFFPGQDGSGLIAENANFLSGRASLFADVYLGKRLYATAEFRLDTGEALVTAGEGGYRVAVTMTLTAPGCGMGDILKEDAAAKLRVLPGVKEAHVEMTFDPPWEPSRMSDAARLALNMF